MPIECERCDLADVVRSQNAEIAELKRVLEMYGIKIMREGTVECEKRFAQQLESLEEQ